ncbi:MAG: GNAT family protein [Candidatus Neomarinimicrobiota bacterium]
MAINCFSPLKLPLGQECFKNLGLNRIEIHCDVLNERSANEIKACGYFHEGNLRENMYDNYHNRMRTTMLFSKLSSEYNLNSTKDDFFDWAQNQAVKNSESAFGAAIQNLFVSPVLKSVTVRKDYLLFSIYHIDIVESDVVYMGVFKQFIKIKEN